jgi:hypothetical protein
MKDKKSDDGIHITDTDLVMGAMRFVDKKSFVSEPVYANGVVDRAFLLRWLC